MELGEKLYNSFLHFCALIGLGIFGSVFSILAIESQPSIQKFGMEFIFSTRWDPPGLDFGAGVFILGSFLTTAIAISIAMPLSLGVSCFISEYVPGILKRISATIIDLLAGVPSVVYGLWGIFFLGPALKRYLGIPYGIGIFTSSIVLSLMILPILSSISYESMQLVSTEIKQAAYALGATKLDVIWLTIKASKLGMLAGIILGMGRAFGETMAVAMLIGGSYRIPQSIFDPGYTLASIIVHEFRYAYAEPIYRSAMMELALILLLISVCIVGISRLVVGKLWRAS